MLRIRTPTILDLFCGCSGFGLGAMMAGYDLSLSVDVDATLTSSHQLNFPRTAITLQDVSSAAGRDLVNVAGGHIDGIIGGPPCQGFSAMGRSDPLDPRRELLYHFFRVVAEIRPRFFVFENVQGLVFKKNIGLLEAGLELVSGTYSILGPLVLDAADFGAATRRKRVFVVGYDKSFVDPIRADHIEAQRQNPTTVWDAIHDLQGAIELPSSTPFDTWSYAPRGQVSDYAKAMRTTDGTFTGQRLTPHRNEVVSRFAGVPQGGIDKVGRHPRLAWQKQCPTLRAGTGADKGSYQAVRPLHPEEPRVITVREAARLQGFPDWFTFHPTVWHSFRMIGNSVSPIMAKAVLATVGASMGLSRVHS